MNQIVLIGNLGKDVELKEFSNGGCIANFSVATSDNYFDKEKQEWVNRTDWHNIVVKNDAAKRAAQQLGRGTKVVVRGKVKTRSYQKDGRDVYVTEVHANYFSNLMPKQEETGQEAAPKSSASDDFIF